MNRFGLVLASAPGTARLKKINSRSDQLSDRASRPKMPAMRLGLLVRTHTACADNTSLVVASIVCRLLAPAFLLVGGHYFLYR